MGIQMLCHDDVLDMALRCTAMDVYTFSVARMVPNAGSKILAL